MLLCLHSTHLAGTREDEGDQWKVGVTCWRWVEHGEDQWKVGVVHRGWDEQLVVTWKKTVPIQQSFIHIHISHAR